MLSALLSFLTDFFFSSPCSNGFDMAATMTTHIHDQGRGASWQSPLMTKHRRCTSWDLSMASSAQFIQPTTVLLNPFHESFFCPSVSIPTPVHTQSDRCSISAVRKGWLLRSMSLIPEALGLVAGGFYDCL
jgi:hypothetical protein